MSIHHFSKQVLSSVLLLSLPLAMISGCATTPNDPTAQSGKHSTTGQNSVKSATTTFSENELVNAVSTHLGVTAEAAASTIERIFKERGRPVGYITGEEVSGAFTVGARYGKGKLWMKSGANQNVFWQGPTVGFDAGGDASKVFTLVYGLNNSSDIFRRFPGIDGSAYFIAGLAVDYQRTHGITLAPIRSGVGFRLGANVGYTNYTRKRGFLPI